MPLKLRPFGRADFERLIASAESPDFVYQWAGPLFTYPLNRLQLERYLLTSIGSPPTHLIYTALDETDTPVGHIELANIDYVNCAANISRVLVFAGRRGQGLGREMLTLVLRVGFDELKLHRLSLFVFDFNVAGLAAYEHAGMLVEGRLRDVRRVGDRYWSVFQMSMLEDEWRARQATGHTPPAPPAPA